MSWRIVPVAFLSAISLLLMGSEHSCALPTEEVDSTPIAVTAKILIEEREANATRYDQTYKDKWVTVSGTVDRVEGGEVYFRPPDAPGFSDVALHDLPDSVQASVEKNQQFTATCKVKDYVFGTHNLRECRKSEPPTPTPLPTEVRASSTPTLALASTPTPTRAPEAEESSSSTQTPIPTQTSIPTASTPTPVAEDLSPGSEPTPIVVTARMLVEEREANATRYDLTYGDKWVVISGEIVEINDGGIRLYSGISSNFDRIALHDLPDSVQAAVEKYQDITAVCKVGSYGFSIHNLRDCRVSGPASQSIEEPVVTDSQGQPAWVTAAPVRPDDWTTVTQAKDALRLCYYELLTLDRYRSFFETLPRPSPEDVEQTLTWAVFNNGWTNTNLWWREKPVGLPPGSEDIWTYGYEKSCWVGVDGEAWITREPTWNPQWQQ